MQVAEVGYIIDFLQLLSLRIYSIYFTYKDSTNEYKNPPLFSGKKNIRQNLKGTQLYFYKTPTLSSTNLI